MSRTAAEAFRFLTVGAVNTAITGLLFYGLSGFLSSAVAYTVAFALGVVFATIVTPRFVFLSRPTINRRLGYVAWYVFIYAVGLLVVHILTDVLGVGRALVVFVSVAGTAVLSFLGARLLFSNRVARGRP